MRTAERNGACDACLYQPCADRCRSMIDRVDFECRVSECYVVWIWRKGGARAGRCVGVQLYHFYGLCCDYRTEAYVSHDACLHRVHVYVTRLDQPKSPIRQAGRRSRSRFARRSWIASTSCAVRRRHMATTGNIAVWSSVSMYRSNTLRR